MQYCDEREENACSLAMAGLTGVAIKKILMFLDWVPSRFKKFDRWNLSRVALLVAAGLPSDAVTRVVTFMAPWEKNCNLRLSYFRKSRKTHKSRKFSK